MLAQAYKTLAEDVRQGAFATPATEWFLDNFHLISSQIVEIHRHLPRRYYRELPALATRQSAGDARIYAIAVELLRYSDSRLDLPQLTLFLNSYQRVAPLTLGELWAWPSMLKLALIENLRRLSDEIMNGRDSRKAADTQIERLDAASAEVAVPIPERIHDSYIVQLLHRAREYDVRLSPLRAALEAHLHARQISAEDVVRAEHQRQAASQASVANAITSLRLCTTVDWRQYVESVSLVDNILRRDPSGVYPRMDFLSRDRQRQAIEEVAERTGEAQIRVALKVVESARQAATQSRSGAAAHVGYYLIGKGRPELELDLAYRPKFRRRLRRLVRRYATAFYLGAAGLVMLALLALALYPIRDASVRMLIVSALFLLIPMSEFALAAVQKLASRMFRPQLLPRLELLDGVPEDARTVVAIPTMLTSLEGVAHLLEHLEVIAIANRDPRIQFALLSDFADAESEHQPDDQPLIEAARAGITALNERLGDEHGPYFTLLHRKRQWNPSEQVWMGWERKRGKLEEFNRLLRGATDTSFSVRVGPGDALIGVRYVLTLDSDTQLPRDTARKLIGIIAHPLNRPVIDPKRRLVTEGYGILQPRVSVTMASAAGSLFARVYAGHTGVDPYTTAVSDVYQDVFREGIYTGKGLYDVDAFMTALDGRVPENALLSHDLFEGLHARAALVTDAEVVDDYPSNVLTHAKRQHRWVRGDWQILWWLFPWVPTRGGGIVRNRLPLIARWKILDNLRRSMVPPALVALLVAGWCLLPGSPLLWQTIAVATMSFAVVGRVLAVFRGPRRSQGLRVFARATAEDLATDLARVSVQLTFIANQAYDMLHAAGLTVARLIRNKGPFLQWETAAAVAQRTRRLDMRGFYNAMTSSPAIAFVAALLVLVIRPLAMPAALPILMLWVAAPAIAFVLSKPAPTSRPSVSEADAEYLRGIAERTWRFFDTYVTHEDRWLPPDNVQFDSEPRVAHRTSPTNIAMSMLSALAAHDLAFIDTARLIATLEATLATVDRLEHFEGHLLNWYDTQSLMPLSPKYVSTVDSGNFAAALIVIAAAMGDLARAQTDNDAGKAMAARMQAVAVRASAIFDEMHFGFLFDRRRQLFAIGYRLGEGANASRMDSSFYDLLASEARLASFVAIAKGDVPERHWFHLGRLITGVRGAPALLSWSATMFEYLMPLLVMRSFPDTLLDESCRMAVMRQIDYAATRGTPWGISESAYTAVDRHGNYQYKAFGVPGLGLKRGLGDELVVAPYATALAVLMEPARSTRNLRRLERDGLLGDFGFYESTDYTDRDGRGGISKKGKIVPAVFAHHAGMSLVAIANALTGDRMVARFHSDTRVQATELLLQERVPRAQPITVPRPLDETLVAAQGLSTPLRRYRTAQTVYPHTQFLSNGKYAVAITNSGGGASNCGNLAITRTRKDPTLDPGSSFIYLRDVRSGTVWSPTHHPVGRLAPRYMATFLPDIATFESEDEEIATKLEVAVSAEHDVELRVLYLVNNSERVREIDVTSYIEVALATPRDDFAHPAFGKLFIETEYLPDRGALICHRRPRAATDPGTWAMHVSSIDARPHGPTEWETDRARFIGRGRSVANPIAMDGRPLTGSTGFVLDPILSLRQRVRLPAGESVKICFAFGVAGDREAAMALAQTYRDPSAAARALALASAHSHGLRRHMDISNDDAVLFERLASRTLGGDGSLRPPASVLATNELGQNSLWPHGISGDLPILLVRVVDEELGLVRQALEAQEYWRLKGLKADLVILNEHPVSYMDEAQSVLTSMLDEGPWRMWKHQPGGAFLLRADNMGAAERALFQAVAQAVMSTDKGDLRAHLAVPAQSPLAAHPLPALAAPGFTAPPQPSMNVAVPPLTFANGLGGFTDEGRTYAIVLDGDQETPAPWVNVIANERFGTILSNSGSATTWSGNSRENRLTPFANDPVADRGGEALFIRDDDTGRAWSPTPGPMPRTSSSGRILIRHSAGVTRFTRSTDGIHHNLDVFVDDEDPVRMAVLTLSNTSPQMRHLSLFSYNDWVLGPPRDGDSKHVITEYDAGHHAILATNPYNAEFPRRVGFSAVSERPISATGNRRSFLGRNGSIAMPTALKDDSLTGEFGAGLDPCAALQVRLTLNAGESHRLVFVLGEARTRQDALALIAKYANADRAGESLKRVQGSWDRLLSAVTVRTPDDSFDTLMNRWLIYQSLSCRIWSRAGYYQPGGAYGFRDQLQDVLCLLHAAPNVAREHILRAASRQFVEGDVQHWWHEPAGRGLRSRCSDDMLWLPLVAMEYVRVTGDAAILDVEVPFLQGAPLPEGEAEAYDLPTVSNEKASLFEHCRRAIDRGITFGPHGLPLIGVGDWNDGMNRVGHEGRGESTWLGFFLFEILNDFAQLCDARNDAPTAQRYRDTARHYSSRLEAAWDGEWFRRGYYDDGRPLGSAQNDECRIDSISQSWALLSGAVSRPRADRALDALRAALVVRPSRIMLLLTPAFDKSDQDPGSIKGYPPGIRENGGQYTHAAVWALMAIARQGNGDESAELFHMLNPINHTRTPADVSRYRTEPYVLDGDVYARPPHDGRGGWSWYTGSAGWLYRAGLESILGLRRRGSSVVIEPCIPSSWDSFSITWRIGETTYEIEVTNPEHVWTGVVKAELDGAGVDVHAIPVVEDGNTHHVHITMGRRSR